MGQTVSGSARSYSYDGLNRLTSTSQGESYGYDRYGNRAVTARTGLPPLTLETPTATTAYSTSSNRIAGFGYDSRGNVTTVPGPNSTNIRIASYDAENHQTSETNVNGVSATYGYDGEGRRVTKTTAGVTTTFVYDAAGELVAEYGGTPSGTGRQFLTVDHLGTTRQITDASGAVIKTKDFLPLGEELNVACYSTDNGPGFTGQYGDKESCLDYFIARYVSPAQGRFTGPDETLVDQSSDDPQSWNLFSYVRNNPLISSDPSGQKYRICIYEASCFDASDPDFSSYTRERGYAFANGDIWASDSRVGYYWWIEPDQQWGLQVLKQAGERADRDLTTSSGVLALGAVSMGATYAGPAIVTGLVAMGEIGAVGPGAGAVALRQQAARIGSDIVKRLKLEGVGQGARSGQHGVPYARASTELVQMANKLSRNDPMREALKAEAGRLLNKAKGISH